MSTNKSSKANILWFLPTHGDGRYLAPRPAAARSTSIICARSRRLPTNWVIRRAAADRAKL